MTGRKTCVDEKIDFKIVLNEFPTTSYAFLRVYLTHEGSKVRKVSIAPPTTATIITESKNFLDAAVEELDSTFNS
jgi:hypothetical protein